MGFLDDLLLGEGPEFQTRSLSTISPEQREALNQLLSQMQGRTPSQFGGQRNTGLSNFEQASLTALEERSKSLAVPDPTLQAAGGAVQQLTDFEGQTADASAYFKSNVQDPLLESFQREILPQISRSFGGADFFSTERQASEGLARQDLLQELTAQKSAVELDQYNQSRNRALQAAGLAPGLSQAENQRTQTQIDILKAAGIEREVEQAGLDRNYAEFVRQQQEQQHIDQELRQLTLTPTIENLAMENPGNAGLIATLLGALAQGAGRSLGNGIDWGDLLGQLFGGGNTGQEQVPNGQSPADGPYDENGSRVTDIPGQPPIPIYNPGANPAPTPSGSVTITDQNGNPVQSTPQPQPGLNLPGGGLAGGVAGAVGAGLAGGSAPAGSVLITEGVGQVASQVAAGAASGAGGAAGAAGGAAGAGTGAGAGAGASGSGAAAGIGAAAAAAAVGWAIADAANYALGHNDRRYDVYASRMGFQEIKMPNQGKMPGATFYEMENGKIISQKDLEWLARLSRETGPGRDEANAIHAKAISDLMADSFHSDDFNARMKKWLDEHGYAGKY